MLSETILVLHAAATGVLVGVIWFVQVVHYPLMARVGPQGFPKYAVEHQQRTTFIVAPTMVAEALLAALLVILRPTGIMPELAWIGLGLIGVIWGSTFLAQVPIHARLEDGFDQRLFARLVSTNWLRTTAWTLRFVIALEFLRRGAAV